MHTPRPQSLTAARTQQGFSLVEMMTAVVIVGILAAFAVPTYQAYVENTEDGTLTANIFTIEMFQEDFFMRNGEYAQDLGDIDAIEDAIGWRPRSDDGIEYAIAASDGTTYEVTATHPAGQTICIVFPDRQPCADP